MNFGYILLFLFCSAQAHVHVIPLAYNDTTQSYYVLLGRGVGENFWSDFKITQKDGESPEAAANRAFFYQTNKKYNIQFAQAPRIEFPNGDAAYYILVNFKSGKELYTTARNQFKNDFVWIPVAEILRNQKLTRLSEKKELPISEQTRELLSAGNWNKIMPPLTSTSQRPTTQSWFNIPGAIYFYTKGEPYYEFTNFEEGYPVDPDKKGNWWPTTEHYYQAQKFTNHPAIQEEIRKLPTARAAFKKAQDNKTLIRPDWKAVNLDIMHKAVKDKFTRYSELKNLLLDTQDKILVENAGSNDNFFGAGADGLGENHLGRILMRVREELLLTDVSRDLLILSSIL